MTVLQFLQTAKKQCHTAVSDNNLMKKINERWDCQREMIPNHFCVILGRSSFSEAKLLGLYGKI